MITHAPRSFSQRAGRRVSLVSLTPLIDVVFILLLFFMLAYSLSNDHQIVLDTPAASHGQTRVTGSLLVEVRTDGVRYAGHYLSLDRLVERVRRARSGHPDRRVLVRSGNGVTLQDTVRVLDALSNAGVTHISMMAPAASSPD